MKKETFIYGFGKSSLGLALVALSDFGIVAVMTGKTQTELLERLQDKFRKQILKADARAAKDAVAQVVKLIDNPRHKVALPVDIRGTPFQQRVWETVRKIPYGETSTYAAIAKQIYAPRAMRAVGSSCTKNHLFMVVPCHRVLHSGETAAHFSRASPRHRMLILRETGK